MSHMKDGTVKPTGLESIETASSDELRELQFERLRWSIRHTYEKRRPRRKKCDIEGVHPTDLTRLEELARFPFNSKQDLRDTYPFGMFAVPEYFVTRCHLTWESWEGPNAARVQLSGNH